MISTIIGGGIVGLPFAFIHTGIPLGIASMMLVAWLSITQCDMFVVVKEMTPGNYESLYELGFVLMGTPAIYLIAICQALGSFGLELIYFIIIGDICKSFATQQDFFMEHEKSIFKTRGLYVILFGIMLFPFIIKKELQELKIASQILFFGVLSFIVILSYQIAF